jgi:hypothetical protein
LGFARALAADRRKTMTSHLLTILAQAQAAGPAALDVKALEAAIGFAQALMQWAFVILGGTLVMLVGTSYHRPEYRSVRLCYLLLLPAWVLLAMSIRNGLLVQQGYLAYLFNHNSGIATSMADDASKQIDLMRWGLIVLASWIFVYLQWWIWAKIPPKGERG